MKYLIFILVCFHLGATSYFISPTGNDGNNGLSSGSPWLSPNHSLNCGDVITAASGTYNATNFEFGKWGNVTCSGHGVAWLTCGTFDACKISSTNQNAIWVTASHWGVSGWETTATGMQAICFSAFPPSSGGGANNLTDIIFANDIANGCYGAGFQPVNNGSSGIDYFVVVGSISYNAAQQSTQCGSGITVFSPSQVDGLSGTHIYVSQTFNWNNFNPSVCAGTNPTDGEGIVFDTWNANSYTQQGVIQNNISFLNGSSGFRVVLTTMATIYVINNTSFGNNGDHNMNSTECGEITLQQSFNVSVSKNITQTNASTGCGTNPNYAFYVANGNGTDSIAGNFGYSATGNNCGVGGGGFSCGSNTFGTNPSFASAPMSNPGAPSCTGKTNVINCVSTIISDFVPSAMGTSGLGYQVVSGTPIYDPLFPSWLCNVGLPSGIVTMGCANAGGASNFSGPIRISGSVLIQ